jgi:hypothetical protein
MDKLIQRMTNVNKYTDLELHLLTFGISSDPLTQFAMVLAALIHDGTHVKRQVALYANQILGLHRSNALH